MILNKKNHIIDTFKTIIFYLICDYARKKGSAMINFEKHNKINEYDKIILNWKNDKNLEPMRYVCIEDTKDKCWMVYDSKTGLHRKVPFGFYTEWVFNYYVISDKESLHHNKALETAKKNNIEFDEETYNKYYEFTKNAMLELQNIFSNLPHWYDLARKEQLIDGNGKNISINELQTILINQWKMFRFACFPKCWSEYVSLVFPNKEEILRLSKIITPENENIEDIANEMIESNYEQWEEANETINKIVQKSFVCYYDYVNFINENGISTSGRCFIVFDEIYLFYWDLYHILVSRLAKMPHICPRCNQLFFSNNNKARYCKECKSESNVIRNENRMKSVRYIHKKIYDKLNNSKFHSNDEIEMFLAESNYYWDIIKNKKIKKNPLFVAKIETEDDYKKWLEEKLKSI